MPRTDGTSGQDPPTPPSDHRSGHWFEPIAAHLGEAYLRYSFTRGTAQDVDGIVELAGLRPGQRVLDVGCGPGRHAIELAARGFEVVGVDISTAFVELARAEAARRSLPAVSFEVADARRLVFDQDFDLVISLCQGAFGLTGGPGGRAEARLELDEPILAGMARALKPDGLAVVSAFSAYFQVRFPPDRGAFDAELGVQHEHTEVKSPEGETLPTELWTTCYTPRELRLLARVAGLTPVAVHGVRPGRYRAGPPNIECPEFLLVARRGV